MRRNAIVLAFASAAVVLGSVSFAGAMVIPTYPRHKTDTASTYTCNSELGYLRRVFPQQIDTVIDERMVTVTPVCEGEDNSLRNDGNVGGLRTRIAENQAMAIALGWVAYEPEDVIGVRMLGDGKAILYVQTSRY